MIDLRGEVDFTSQVLVTNLGYERQYSKAAGSEQKTSFARVSRGSE